MGDYLSRCRGSGPLGVDLPPTQFNVHARADVARRVTVNMGRRFRFRVRRQLGAHSASVWVHERFYHHRPAIGYGTGGHSHVRLVRSPVTQSGASSVPEEDAIELTEGWRNSQGPSCMVTLPKAGAAAAVDLKRMFDYAQVTTALCSGHAFRI